MSATGADPLPGDELIPDAPLSWDRETELAAAPAAVWPWIVQLGKGRAGWYLPARLERLIPDPRRALHRIDPAYATVAVGERVPDYGPGGWFEAHTVDPPHALVWWTQRGRDLQFSWALVLEPLGPGAGAAGGTRLRVRIRMNRRLGSRLRPVLEGGGELTDRAFISLMLSGLRERVERGSSGGSAGSVGSPAGR